MHDVLVGSFVNDVDFFCHRKGLSIRYHRTCQLKGVLCFLNRGKFVLVVLREGEYSEEVKLYVMNR